MTKGPYEGYTIKDGWLVPEVDTQCLPWVLNEVPKFDAVLKYVKNFDSCIQAGGNIGVFPKLLSKHFKNIYSYEPDPANFKALMANVASETVIAYPMALGEKQEFGEVLVLDPTNIGAHRMGFGRGTVKVNTIDYLHHFSGSWYDDVGLIWLDIEGAELLALKGGVETIKSNKPVIVLEMAGHSQRFYNIPEDDTYAWLHSLGYEAVEHVQQDVIFVHKGDA